jgi:outer membrane protein TolC
MTRSLLVALVAYGAPLPLLAAAQDSTGAAPVVTLAEARRRALAVDPVTIAASSRVNTAAWERRAALADVVTPRVTGSMSYTHFSDSFFNFGTGRFSPNATAASLEASYTVLGGGKLSTLRSARAGLASAEANDIAARFETALATDAAYFAVLADRELLQVATERLRRAEEQLGVARARVLAGEAIASDSLQLLLEATRSRLGLLQRDSAVVGSRLELGQRIGLDGPADAAAIDTSLPPQLPLTPEEATREMRERGPDIEAARADERSADALLTAERARYLPEVAIGATTGAYDSEIFPSAFRRTQLSVTVSMPFWDGGQRELSVARRQAERSVARAHREERERSAAERIARAHSGYRTSRAAIELAQVGVAAAAESYRVQRARYAEGATTILDLLESQVALSEAEAALVQARFATRLALAQIEALLGRRLFEPNTNDPAR